MFERGYAVREDDLQSLAPWDLFGQNLKTILMLNLNVSRKADDL